jgi:copper chaperone CopZ
MAVYIRPIDWLYLIRIWRKIMVEITVGIEGMACGMCEAHINEAVRKAFKVKKVSSSHTKKRTVIIAEQDIPEQELKEVIAKTGYDFVSVSSKPYEKKGFFHLDRI